MARRWRVCRWCLRGWRWAEFGTTGADGTVRRESRSCRGCGVRATRREPDGRVAARHCGPSRSHAHRRPTRSRVPPTIVTQSDGRGGRRSPATTTCRVPRRLRLDTGVDDDRRRDRRRRRPPFRPGIWSRLRPRPPRPRPSRRRRPRPRPRQRSRHDDHDRPRRRRPRPRQRPSPPTTTTTVPPTTTTTTTVPPIDDHDDGAAAPRRRWRRPPRRRWRRPATTAVAPTTTTTVAPTTTIDRPRPPTTTTTTPATTTTTTTTAATTTAPTSRPRSLDAPTVAPDLARRRRSSCPVDRSADPGGCDRTRRTRCSAGESCRSTSGSRADTDRGCASSTNVITVTNAGRSADDRAWSR